MPWRYPVHVCNAGGVLRGMQQGTICISLSASLARNACHGQTCCHGGCVDDFLAGLRDDAEWYFWGEGGAVSTIAI